MRTHLAVFCGAMFLAQALSAAAAEPRHTDGTTIIAGRGVDKKTQLPAAHLVVELARGDHRTDHVFAGTLVDIEHTDASGHFAFVGGHLPPDTYSIRLRDGLGQYGNIVTLRILYDAVYQVGTILTGPMAVGLVSDAERTYAGTTLWFLTDRGPSAGMRFGTNLAPRPVWGSFQTSVGLSDATACPNAFWVCHGDRKYGSEVERGKLTEKSGGVEGFAAALADSVRHTGRRDLVIYVHGYGTDFASAQEQASRLALVVAPLKADVLLFSWPSNGDKQFYVADLQSAEDASADLFHLLDTLQQKMPLLRLHLVAHSMGNYVLFRALEKPLRVPLTDAVMAAADVPLSLVHQKYSLVRRSLGRTLVLSSADDKALKMSQCLSTHARLGLTLQDTTVGGIVDAGPSAPKTDYGHLYFVNSRDVVQREARFVAGAPYPASFYESIDWLGTAATFPSLFDTWKMWRDQAVVCSVLFKHGQ